MTDCPDGFKHFERTPISTSMEGDFDTGNVRYKARERLLFRIQQPKIVSLDLKALKRFHVKLKEGGIYCPLLFYVV